MTRDWTPILKNISTNFVEIDFEALEKLEWVNKDSHGLFRIPTNGNLLQWFTGNDVFLLNYISSM